MNGPTPKTQAAKLRKLLTSADQATVKQGLELAVQLDDPAILHELVDGATFVTNAELPEARHEKAVGRIVPNAGFTGVASKTQNLLDYNFARLVARTDHPVKESVTALRLGVWQREQTDIAMDLAWLRNFPNLRRLNIAVADAQTRLDGLEAVPITKLRLLRQGRVVPALGSHSTLQTITGTVALEAGGSWPQLRSARVDARCALTELATSAPLLEELHVYGGPKLVGAGAKLISHPNLLRIGGLGFAIADCPKLTHASFDGPVDISGTPALKSLEIGGQTTKLCDLSQLTSVEQLRLPRRVHVRHLTVPPNASLSRYSEKESLELAKVEDLGNISDLKGLTRLAISTDVALSLEPLRGANELVELSIEAPVAKIDLSPLAQLPNLRVLDIRRCTGISDLTPLIDTPMLQIVAIRDSGVTSEPLELGNIVTRVDVKKFDKHREANKPKARRPSKLSPIPVAEEHRAAWDRVRHGLFSDHWAPGRPMANAIDTAIGLGDPAIDFLLSKVKVFDHRIQLATPFKVGSRNDDTDRLNIVCALLSAASPGSMPARKLRERTMLRVVCPPSRRYSFDSIDQFRSLETLFIQGGGTRSLAGIANLANLHTLVLSVKAARLPVLPASLRRLMIDTATRSEDLWPLLSESNVEELALLGPRLDRTDIRDAGPLPIRSLTATPETANRILHDGAWPKLEEFELYLEPQKRPFTLRGPLPVDTVWLPSFEHVSATTDPKVRALMKVRDPLHFYSWEPTPTRVIQAMHLRS